MSVVSLYYYLNVIKQMYLYQPDGDASRWRLTPTGYLTTGVLTLGVVVVGVYAAPLYTMADRASRVLF
jgi:NADH-quinone oxidoreductase subunit N